MARKASKASNGRPAKPKRALTHVDKQGQARMVDVSTKPVQVREAVARGAIFLQRETLVLIAANQIAKGDVLNTARLAGIQAAKRTSELIPLCHPLNLSHVDVALIPRARPDRNHRDRQDRRANRRRDGSAHRRHRHRADDLRYVQGGRTRRPHRGYSSGRKNRRQIGSLSRLTRSQFEPRLFQRTVDRSELAVERRAQPFHGRNNRERDTGSDQSIFDRRGRGFVGKKFFEQGFHCCGSY